MRLSKDEIDLIMNHRVEAETQRVARAVSFYTEEKENERRRKAKQSNNRRSHDRDMDIDWQ